MFFLRCIAASAAPSRKHFRTFSRLLFRGVHAPEKEFLVHLLTAMPRSLQLFRRSFFTAFFCLPCHSVHALWEELSLRVFRALYCPRHLRRGFLARCTTFHALELMLLRRDFSRVFLECYSDRSSFGGAFLLVFSTPCATAFMFLGRFVNILF